MGKEDAKKQYRHFVPAVRKVPEWYKNFNFILVTSMEQLDQIFKDSKWEPSKSFISFDTETTGLNFEEADIVGYSFCIDGRSCYYVPVNHFEYEHNLGDLACQYIYDRLCEARFAFMYNARYDMRIFEYIGYKDKKAELDKKRWKFVKYDFSKVNYFDVMDAVWLADTNLKMPSLKDSSLHFLGFEQMHFEEVIEDAGNFFYLNPSENPDTVYYAAADALCTYLLVPKVMPFFKEAGVAGQVDNKVLYPLMHCESEKIYLDKELLDRSVQECVEEVDRLEKEVYEAFGYVINLNSPAQVSQALERLGIDTGEKTASGNMATGIDVLEALPDEMKEKFPALNAYLKYKEMFKLLNSYLSVYKKEADKKGYLRAAYKLQGVPTGRLATGKDGKNTYFSPTNVQSVPKPHVCMYDVFDLGDRNLFSKKENIIMGFKFVMSQYDGNKNHIIPNDPAYIGWAEGMNPKLNVRATMTPKMYEDSGEDEFVYVACDYAAQELRIVANMSSEPVWANAFLHGKDVHRSTAESLWGAENYNKDLRKRAKGVNFGIVYGMGAPSMIDPKYGINTLADAEEFFNHYKKTLPTLFQWIERKQRAGRKNGTVYTFFGRPRRVKGYFDNGNFSFANRTIINTQIQGSAADMLKLVICKLWKNVLNNPKYMDDVSWKITIHDEIGYSVRTTRCNELVGVIESNQTMKFDQWPIPLICEASVGWSVGGLFAFERRPADNEFGYQYWPKCDD